MIVVDVQLTKMVFCAYILFILITMICKAGSVDPSPAMRYPSSIVYKGIEMVTESIKQEIGKKAQASLLMRQKILDTTIEILGTEGYTLVTANNLSQKAGVSKGALYHHFANLEEVKVAALEQLINQFMISEDPTYYPNLSDYLSETGEGLFATMTQQPAAMKAMYAFISQAMVDEHLKKYLGQLTNHSLEQYRNAINYFYPNVPQKRLAMAVQALDAYFTGTVIQWFLLDEQPNNRWPLVARRFSWNLLCTMLIAMLSEETSI
jgi:AcrR family transcriptional regulator